MNRIADAFDAARSQGRACFISYTCAGDPDYVTAPDWQHGWSVVWSQRDYFHVEQVAVVKGRYNYHGKVHGRRRLSPSAHFEVEDLST